MKLQDQVISLESAKKLKELGVEQESYLNWWKDRVGHWEISHWPATKEAQENSECISAFTVAELREMLPDCIKPEENVLFLNYDRDKQDSHHFIDYLPLDFNSDDQVESKTMVCKDTEAEARAAMLIYLLEKGLIKNQNQ
ncbi:MAG: hypothetical protein KGI27_12930 [Thaumarchaeota archaeon]|nr:hypothetical protein [Nitrososphaerota archaeon]